MTGGNELLLRPAKPDEISHLQAIEAAARSRYLALEALSFVAAVPAIAADRLAQGDVIVAESKGDPVGFVLMTPLDGFLHIANISVATGLSGRGIGSALIEAATIGAATASLPALTLTTFKARRWNGPWFRRLGFTAMPDDAIGPGLQRVLERQRQTVDASTRETLWRPA
jgi:predicted N-acetyltransferase YhbS